ncbi:hypothetical protein ACHWQZ_G017298 [Mnemiopsis leidyi]
MSCTELRDLLTPGAIKVLTITLFLDLLSFSGTVYHYLGVVNLYNLIEDPTLYIKFTAVFSTVTALPTSLLNDMLYKIPPAQLMPALYFVKGTSLFLYGVIMYQSSWDPYLKLGLAFIVLTPLHFAANFDNNYFERHLYVELSRKYGVKLGITNSGRSIIGSATAGVQVVVVGIIYNSLSLEDSSLYLCSFCYILAITMTIVSRKLFQDYPGVPQREHKTVSLISNLKTQVQSLLRCKVFKILLAHVLDTMTISHAYMSLFFLRSGLDELTMSYVTGLAEILHIFCAVVNIVKYNYRWSSRFADMFIVGHVIALLLMVYVTACWSYEVLVPWFLQVDEVEHSTMPGWMVGYFVLSLSTNLLVGTIKLVKQEFLQDNIPSEDRGSIAGVTKFISLSIHIAISAVNVWLPDTYLYLFNFVISVVVHIITLGIMFSYKFQEEAREKDVSSDYEDESMPLTSNKFSIEDES